MLIGWEEWDWTFYRGSTFLTVLGILTQYKWRRHRFLLPPERSQVEVEFPRTPHPQ